METRTEEYAVQHGVKKMMADPWRERRRCSRAGREGEGVEEDDGGTGGGAGRMKD